MNIRIRIYFIITDKKNQAIREYFYSFHHNIPKIFSLDLLPTIDKSVIIVYNITKEQRNKEILNYLLIKEDIMSTSTNKPITDKKIVSISSKRQITIPQKFFTMLGFATEAECIVQGNELIIRPARQYSGGEFAEQILADLISQGLSGDELLDQFKAKQAQVRPAVESMIARAQAAANSEGEYCSYDDVFSDTEEPND